MTDRCEHLDAYVDGELGDDEHAAFEAHLATCDACHAELPRLLALMAALDTAVDATARAAVGSTRLTVLPGGLDAPRPSAPAGLDAPRPSAPAEHKPAPRRPVVRRSWQLAAGIAGTLALAAGLLVILRPATRPPAVASLQGDLRPTRSLEARLSYPGAAQHRPVDVARGAQTPESISLDRLVELEHARNWHGLAVASLLAGDRERAVRSFAQAASTPEVDSDRAALELVDGSPAALERALEDVDRALAAAPGSGAARWNRALVLAGLNAPLAAARDLDRVAALGEPGWADEARTRAAGLRAAVAQRRTRWTQANVAGPRLIEDGTAVPAELTSVTGYLTIMLYDAVRAAPSRSRVEALLPLAQALDSAYRSDRLAAYVRRIAASDFAIRAPFAARYRDVVLQRPGADVEALLAQLENTAPATDDLWLGAIVRAGRVAAHLDAYRRRALATQDPWFAIIAEHETARAELARGARAAAERRLRDAVVAARRDRLTYRALLLEIDLIALYRQTHNQAEADAEARAVFREATAAGEWLLESNVLGELAAISHNRYAHGLTRAYLAELIERSEYDASTAVNATDEPYDCLRRQFAYQELAIISLLQLDPARSRDELARAPACRKAPTLIGVAARAELYRLGHRAEDAELVRQSLPALRAAAAGSGMQAMLDHVEGNVAIETDRAAGRRLLRDAIAKAGDQRDELSVKARAYSFSLLALDAGRAAEFGDVVALLAETLGVTRPERCVVAIAVQSDRSVVAFADAQGEIGGQYVAHRTSAELDAAALVPANISDRLRACEHVSVMTRAPVLGAGRLLPPALAWSYLLARPASPPVTAPAAHRLVVANPLAPPELNLPPLGPYPDDAQADGAHLAGDTTVLRGADATPTRVLLAMRDAAVVEFHTHGFIANDVSEASYLVLSPELDRQYAMTAGDIAGTRLTAAPLIILGACHAATSSRSLEGGMGLAEAFLRSGARAVIASPDAIQDRDAHAFFAVVRDRAMHGIDPAIAVRDERVRRLAASHDDTWVSGVVVFE
jgi:CHAT domain-containing protein/putative zinc finger protein